MIKFQINQEGFIRFSQRSLTVVLMLAILIPSLSYFFLFKSQKAEAAWYDDAWAYRQRIDITNTGSAQTNYQIAISISTAALITAGKLQGDCDDIRITDVNGKLLPHWIQTNVYNCNSSATKIWVKVPSIAAAASGNTTSLYLYYGNPSASNVESGGRVFNYFEDFTQNTNNKWIGKGGTLTVSGGVASWTTASCSYFYNSIDTVSAPNILEYGARPTAGTEPNPGIDWPITGVSSYGNSECDATTSGDWYLFSPFSGLTNGKIYEHATTTYTQQAVAANTSANGTWYDIATKNDGSGNLALLVNGSSITTYADASPRSNGPGYIAFREGSFDVDWVFARTYAATEPVATVDSTVDKTTGPIAYWKFDEGSGTTLNNATGRTSLNGSLGTPTWTTEDQCVSGKCIKNAGSGQSSVSYNADLNITSNVTYNVWVKVTQPNAATWPVIMGRDTHKSYGFRQNKSTSSNSVYFEFGTGACDGTSWSAQTLNSNVVDSKWHMLTMTQDGTNLNLYYDGIRVIGPIALTGFCSDTSAALTFATSLYGYVDEAKIYNYALSSDQIKANYATKAAESASVLGASRDNSQGSLSNGLVGYYKMDESSWTNDCSTASVTDSSGNGNNAKSCPSTTGPTGGSTGKFGNAGDFDGSNDYVSVDSTSSLDPGTGDISVSLWVNPDTITDSQTGLVRYYNGGTTYYILEHHDDDRLQLEFRDGVCTGYSFLTTATLTASTWNHVVLTIDRDKQAAIYINNGTPTTSTVVTNCQASMTGGTLNFGRHVNYFDGKIDETRIYNRALSPAEVSSLYNFAPGPVGYWKFDEGSGGTTADSSTNAYTATWSGSGTHWTPGKIGKAGKFDGSTDYLSAGDNLDMGTGNFTLMAWIKKDTSTGNGKWEDWIIGKRPDATQAGYAFDVRGSNFGSSIEGKLSFRIYDGTNSFAAYTSNDRVDDNVWHHVAAVVNRTSGTLTMYIDGTSRTLTGTSIAGVTGSVNNAESFLIGNSNWNTSSKWAGNLDEVKVYNYTRTAGQIIEDMNGGHPLGGSPVGSPTAWYKFDEGYGQTINNNGSGGSSLSGYRGGTSGTDATDPSFTQNGKFGKALTYSRASTQFDTFLDNSALDVGTGSITVTFWAKATSYTSASIPISKGGPEAGCLSSSNTGYEIRQFATTYTFRICYWTGSAGLSAAATSPTVSDTADSTWRHIAAVYDRDTQKMRLYINGVAGSDVDASTLSTNNVDTSTDLTIGGRNNQHNFNGDLDEVKIYKAALTTDQIKLDMNQGQTQVLGALSDKSTYDKNAANQEYCVPGDTISSSCAAPIARWTMEEGSGTTTNDISGNANTGTIANATWTPGKLGKALKFDGSGDWVSVANESNFDFSSDFTISLWINVSSTSGTGYYGVIGKYQNDSTGWDLGISNGRPRMSLRGTGNIDPGSGIGSDLRDNTWHHITAVNTNSSIKTYVDGVLANTTSGTWTATLNNTAVAFGNRQASAGTNPLIGKLDDIRIYNYARTAQQVVWDYNKGGPALWWRLDDCQGTTLGDASGNGNSGTLVVGAGAGTTHIDSVGTCSTSSTSWGSNPTGKRNYSLTLDGIDDYAYKNMTISGSDGTIAFWVKNGQQVVAAGNYLFRSDANVRTYISVSGTTITFTKGNPAVSCSTTTLNPSAGTWTHVVLKWWTASGTQSCQAYANGVSLGTAQTFLDSTTGSYGVIGAFTASGTQNAYGIFDDVRIYNYALSDTQIKQLYSGTAINFLPVTGTP